MLKGILFAFLGFASHSVSDAFVKHAGSVTNVFVIGFFLTLFSTIPWMASRGADEKWRNIIETKRPFLVHLRALASLGASILCIYAFTKLPIAEAYALIFLVPFSVTVFAVLTLGEKVDWRRWLLLAVGFAGILMVIRPGFREVNLAHLAGVGVAIFAGCSVTLTRHLTTTENTMTLMGVLFFWQLLVYFILMLPGFVMPSGSLLLTLFAGGLTSGFGHLLVLRGIGLAPANSVGAMQYTQIIWAVILGAVFFAEFPDLLTYGGLAVVGLAGLLSVLGASNSQKGTTAREAAARELV